MKDYFATNLRFLREQRKLSQNKLSEYINTSQANINRWEDGSVSPGIDKVDSIAKFFNIRITDLICKDLRTGETIEDKIIMTKDTGKYKKGDEVTTQELIDYANELQDKLDRIKESL